MAWLCEALGVSRSGFHAWLTESPSARSRSDEVFGAKVRRELHRQRPNLRCAPCLARCSGRGALCGLHRIERLMRVHGLRASPRGVVGCRRTGRTAVAAVAPNMLDRAFEAGRRTRSGSPTSPTSGRPRAGSMSRPCIDLFSRRVVGWSMSAAMTAQLVTDALVMAIWRRGRPDALLHHSDQGSQYTSEQFQRLMADNGVNCSMSRSGNVWDNAAMESFFSSLKTERTARKTIGRETRPRPTCSTTSSASTIRRDGTRRSAISARWSSKERRS